MTICHSSVYGFRAKLWLITPSTNTVNEAEWAAMMPDDVTHTHRMRLHSDTTSPAGKAALMADLKSVFAMLKQARSMPSPMPAPPVR